MADLIRFVDSVAASPTVLLDVNDDVKWNCTIKAPPPRLTRSVSVNAMRDGGSVSSSTYGMRTVSLDLELLTASQDTNATELQKLARLLDQESGFLMYQPTGATKPVFFHYYRSDISNIEDVVAQKALRKPDVELLCDPFALGLKETLGPFTINNDPALTNGHYVDLTGVIGDVAAPCVIRDSTAHTPGGIIAMRQHGTPSNLNTFMFTQGESPTASGTDTSNPGGGPDAAMSGTATNNFMRTTFATNANMFLRLYDDKGGPLNIDNNGRFRLLLVARRSDATSVINVKARVKGRGLTVNGDVVPVPLSTSRQLLDLGVFDIGANGAEGGYGSTLKTYSSRFELHAQRVSGSGTIDYDYWFWLPADESLLTFRRGDATAPAGAADLVIDSVNESITKRMGSQPTVVEYDAFPAAGGFPSLEPNQTNRMFYIIADLLATPYTISVTATASVTVEYYPRYVFVRPAAS